MTTKIKLSNSFHNSETTVSVTTQDGVAILSQYQVRRVNRALCGVSGCTCSGPLGLRGFQHDVKLANPLEDGGAELHLRGF